MPKTFEYTAHAGDSIRRDVMTAEDEKAVRAYLREQGMYPLEIKIAARKGPNPLLAIVNALKPAKAKDAKAKTPKLRVPRQYLYTALPKSGGDPIKGELMALDDREVRQLLRERGLLPVKVGPKPFYYDLLPSSSKIAGEVERGGKAKKAGPSAFELVTERLVPQQFRARKIPLKEVVFYVQQMATMMDAGLSISQTLSILNGNISHKRLLKINQDVQARIFEGVALAEAYSDHRHYLPDVFVELMAIGEQSGNMEETTKRLGDYLEKNAEIQRKVKGALTYPTVMLCLIVLIVIGLMLFVVPTFIQLFSEFKLDLPLTTRILLGTSKFLQHDWWSLPLFGIVLYSFVTWFFRTTVGVQFWDRIEYKLPLFGKLTY
ncbi:MAG: type II secretion system F family protein, partial [Cyanobacteria bacterium REEB65]|nr:type II secretion system F family protein [Cyanobacteria bacterium REEB65]